MKVSNKVNDQEQMEKSLEFAKWRDSLPRKGFDYQERWHGFGSPIGLGFGFAGFALGVYLLSLAWTQLN